MHQLQRKPGVVAAASSCRAKATVSSGAGWSGPSARVRTPMDTAHRRRPH